MIGPVVRLAAGAGMLKSWSSGHDYLNPAGQAQRSVGSRATWTRMARPDVMIGVAFDQTGAK